MSKFYQLLFVLLLLVLPLQLPAQQETERHYRVELIIVRHLAGSSDTTPQESLRDLSDILDLYAPPAESSADTVVVQLEDTSIEPGLTEIEPPEDEPLAVRIDDMSDTMRESWRRLRGSSGFRPELFRAWEQSGDGPFPTLRIHDDEVLFEVDPNALLADVPVDEYGALVFSDETVQLQNQSDADLMGIEEPEPIRYFYRLDGTSTLTRTRFLHLDLDIELREPLFEQADPALALQPDEGLPAVSAKHSAPVKTGPAADAPAFRIHRIQQRRQVNTGQMEYFDGPVIGVLALVTGFDVTPEEAEPQAEAVP